VESSVPDRLAPRRLTISRVPAANAIIAQTESNNKDFSSSPCPGCMNRFLARTKSCAHPVERSAGKLFFTRQSMPPDAPATR